MAPIKLEENIREKLQERELEPSQGSWEKLATQLDGPVRRRNRKPLWLAVAASVTTIIIIGSLLFSNKVEDPNSNTIVNTEDVKAPSLDVNERNDEIVSVERIPEENSVDEAELLTANTEELVTVETSVSSEKNKVSNKKDRSNSPKENSALEMPIPTEASIANTDVSPDKENAYITTKVDEVVTSVKGLAEKNGDVTAEEIDALLLKAQREIQNRKLLEGSGAKIDATALLEDVEWELERTFRDKVFDALGTGYQKIRTAVVERNN